MIGKRFKNEIRDDGVYERKDVVGSFIMLICLIVTLVLIGLGVMTLISM